MQRSSNIPLDLCFDIIDAVSAGRHLDHLRRITLQACARTCSAWLGRARFQLYHDVRWHLLDSPDIKNMGKFSDTIAAFPELGALVTHLDISIWGLQYFPDVWTDEASVWEDETKGPFNLRAAQHLLNLRSIRLFGTRDAPTTWIVESLAQRLSRAPSIRQLTLQYVVFGSVKALVRLLERFPHLTSLEISFVTWADDAEHPADELDSSMSRNLTQLTLSDNSLHLPLLHVFPSTIKVLELGPLFCDKFTPELLEDHYEALSRYTNLEILKLTAAIRHDTDAGWLSTALLHARSLELGELFLWFRFSGVPFQTAVDRARWKEVDDVLSRGPFSSLRRISVKIYSCIGPPLAPADDAEGFIADSRRTLQQHIVVSFNQSARRGIKVIPDVTLLYVGRVSRSWTLGKLTHFEGI